MVRIMEEWMLTVNEDNIANMFAFHCDRLMALLMSLLDTVGMMVDAGCICHHDYNHKC